MLGNIMSGNSEKGKLSRRVKELEEYLAKYHDYDVLYIIFIIKFKFIKLNSFINNPL